MCGHVITSAAINIFDFRQKPRIFPGHIIAEFYPPDRPDIPEFGETASPRLFDISQSKAVLYHYCRALPQIVIPLKQMKIIQQAARKHTDEHPPESLGCLRGASLFSKLSDREIACFDKAAQMRSYKKGKILYVQQEQADFFYIICGGWIKLFHTMPEGEEVIFDMLTVGHMVGESAVFEQGRHTSSAQVIEDVQLVSIPSGILFDQISLNPALALSMLSSMFRHHRRHYGEIALNAMQNAPQRVGCFLLRLCPEGGENNIAFHLPYDKTLIAQTLGMKSATFSRALNILRQKTSIPITGTRIEIDSVDELIKFVYGLRSSKYLPEKM